MPLQETSPQNNYELVSGLEIHVQLNTNTKIFSADSASFGALPNQNISTVSLALPGALPKLNKEVVAKAIRIGLALNCTINQTNHFDRKNYFYADLPKGYQITQDGQPICVNGFLEVDLADGSTKKIGINRIHLEEDAGKSIHDQDDNFSLVDLNRAGVPLIEIVTEPDIRSAEEASALLTEIRKLVRHLTVSDGNMEEGSLRCDANISIRPKGSIEFGTRCEVKNLNSMRNVRRAMDFEFGRQVEVISNGGKIIQSTLNFDSDKGTTSPMRTKEEANDYRYFADPDLQPVFISDDWLAEIKAAMPALPNEISEKMMAEFGISKADAALFAEDLDLLNYFNQALPIVNTRKALINWLIGPIRAVLSEKAIAITEYKVKPEQLAIAINLVDDKKITQKIAIQQLLPTVEKHENADVAGLAQSLNLIISENGDELGGFIDEVLAKYPQQVEAYKKGKKGVLADAKKINELILEKLK